MEEWKKEFDSDNTPSELDALQKRLMKAVKLEEYESAAIIRDDISNFNKKQNKKINRNK